MNDNELIEQAAKVAGVCLHPLDKLHHSYGNWGCDTTCMVCKEDPSRNRWHPLTSNGDASSLQILLATKYGVEVRQVHNSAHAGIKDVFWETENHWDDPVAATRRALVRAAAHIGKTQQ